MTYRDYKLVNLTTNQTDVGGVLPGDTFGTPAATAPSAAAAFGLDRRTDHRAHSDHHQHLRVQLPAAVLAVV